MLIIYALSLLLIGLSGLLIDWHRRSLREVDLDASQSDRDRRFAVSQCRRRTQASAIIGVIGAFIGIMPIVPRTPFWMACYLASLLGGILCILMLALLDVIANQQNFRRLRSEQLAAQVKLARELAETGDPGRPE